MMTHCVEAPSFASMRSHQQVVVSNVHPIDHCFLVFPTLADIPSPKWPILCQVGR